MPAMSSSRLRNNTAADISEFIARTSLGSIPREVREQAKLHLLDGLATMLGGAKEESSRILRRHFSAPLKTPPATVLGALERFCPEHAALINGIQAHVLDYDDAQLATLPSRPAGQQTHPTSPVLAAALAVAESQRRSGASLLASYVVGVEVACRLGDAIEPGHYLDGLHPTGTLGAFGAAAACAHLLELEPKSTRNALGIAGTLASGLRANRGSMAKGLNAGNAARNGVLAATLAAAGFTASQNVFDEPMGFFPAMCRGKVDRDLLSFGKRFFFETPGVAIKLYPCAGVLHPALDLALNLREHHGIEGKNIDQIRVTLDKKTTLPLVYESPRDGLEAKFSLHFAIAAALVDGQAGLRQFTTERVLDARIRALMKRVQLVRRPMGEKQQTGIDSEVEITLKHGALYRARAAIARGHPTLPASRTEIDEKFRQCSDGILGRSVVEKFLKNFSALERLPSVAAWLRPLRPSPR